MNILGRILPVLAAVAITVAVLWILSRGSGIEVNHIEDTTAVSLKPTGVTGAHLGSAGCLGAACHGAPAADTLKGELGRGTWQSSGSCWVAADPHTAAYAVLTSTKKDEQSGRIKVSAEHIMALYAPGTKATDDARCLACHTTPALAKDGHTDNPQLLSQRAEGVSCEACHGSAGGWVRQHTTGEWSADRNRTYAEGGMTKLYDLGERALACAGCHIGAPASADGHTPVRDMNHDMIAAGHPRLNFDFAEYQRRLPKHWFEKDRLTKGDPKRPDEPLKAWLVGRVAHAEAACNLLDSRAARADAGDRLTPWPEFAEYNCAACHHDLESQRGEQGKYERQNWRDNPGVTGKRPAGVPAWQAVWPVAPAIGLTQVPPDLFKGATDPLPAVKQLADLMQAVPPAGTPPPYRPARMPGTAAARPQAGATAAALRKLRGELLGWDERRLEPVVTGALTAGFVPAEQKWPAARDWDSGLQLLFGLAALERSRPRDAAREQLFRDAFGAYRGTPQTADERWKKMEAAIKQLHPR